MYLTKIQIVILFLFEVIFVVLSAPTIREVVMPFDFLVVFPALFFLLTIKPASLIVSWITFIPLLGYGVVFGNYVVSLSDLITVALFFNLVFSSVKVDTSSNTFKILLLSIFYFLMSYLFSDYSLLFTDTIKIILILATVLMGYVFLQKDKLLFWLNNPFSLIVFSTLILFIYEKIFLNSFGESFFRTSSINTIVLYLAIGIYLINLYRMRDLKKPWVFMIILLAVYSFLGESRTGIIYSFVLFVDIIYGYYKRLTLNSFSKALIVSSFVLFTFILGFFIYNNINFNKAGSDLSRFDALVYYLQVVFVNPFFGLGWGGWQLAIDIINPDGFSVSVADLDENLFSLNPHNTFLHVLVDFGFVGLSLFVIILFYLIKSIKHAFTKIFGHSAFAFISIIIITLLLSDIISSPFFWALFLFTLINSKFDKIYF